MSSRREPESMTMTVLRVWLWVVPIAMLIVAGVFGVIAALDGSWGLLAVMVLIGIFAFGLLMVHWWALYRFGSSQDPGASSKRGDEA